MQITGALLRRLVLSIGMVALGIVTVACQTKHELPAVETHPSSPEGLVLTLLEVNGLIAVSIINTGDEDVKINRELRPAGPEPELEFEFNGAIASLENAPRRGQPEVSELQNSVMTLQTEAVTGAVFSKDDLRRLFSLQSEKCYVTRVLYRSTLKEADAFKGKLISIPTSICY